MRVKSYGLFFDFLPTQESTNEILPVTKEYVLQECKNFVLVNYFKGERKNVAYNEEGFQTYTMQMFIEMYMIDLNPRKILYDKQSDSFFRVLDTPINQAFEPNRRKMYRLPIELINDSDLRFDSKFIRNKFDELWEALNNGTL